MEVINLITQKLGDILGYYFGSDMDVMSPDAKNIFSNKADRDKYIAAVEKLKTTDSKEETITLSTNEKVTLVS